jgi:hypothetical protein
MPKPFYLKYSNSQGVEVDLTDRPYLWSVNNLADYEWTIEQSPLLLSGIGAAKSRLIRGTQSKNVEIVVYRGGGLSVYADIDYLTSIFEGDVLRGEYGRLYIGDQYCEGNFVSSIKTIQRNIKIAKIALTFRTDRPFWISEERITLPIYSGETNVGFVYPFHYPFGYTASLGARQIINDHYAATSAIITLYGPATDPQIAVDSHIYKVSGELGESERYVINQPARTVQKITQSGEVINAFAQRGKTYSVFQPIPPGESIVFHNGEFAAEITLLKERSEPRWS